MKRISVFLMVVIMIFSLAACGADSQESETDSVETEVVSNTDVSGQDGKEDELDHTAPEPSENFVLITGGTFEMGSPDTEAWRSEDKTQHIVTVSDFYMSMYKVTQAEYTEVIGGNPSSFFGDTFPVETVSWLDAIRYCNTRSEMEGLTPAYSIRRSDGNMGSQCGRLSPADSSLPDDVTEWLVINGILE